MSKIIKLIVSIFVGIDIFFLGVLGLSQLRVALFGEGQIPGGGSALDMALWLLPLFVAYVAGDRLFYFLTYKERRAARLKLPEVPQKGRDDQEPHEDSPNEGEKAKAAPVVASVWDEGGWQDDETGEKQ